MSLLELSSAVLALMCAAPAGPVATTPGGAAAASDEAAQQAFRSGVDAARQERWPDARTYFERAYALSPRPVVLINLAGAQARTGKLTEAAKNYRRILDDESMPETASFRRAAAETLPALEARIPRIRLRPSGLTPTDVIQVDGQTVDVAAVASGHSLDPGEHTLVVRHGASERARVLFTLVERELRYIALPLPAVAQRPSPGAPPLLVDGAREFSADPVNTGTPRSPWRSPWTWTAIAVVVVATSLATTYAVMDGAEPFSGNIVPGRIEVR